MDIFYNNQNEFIINKLYLDDIPRCPDCNLICSLQLNYEQGIAIINFECENKHKGTILLKDYMTKYNKFALSNEKCSFCGKKQKEIKGNFFYCIDNKIFLCNLCLKNNINHNIIPYEKYDGLCKIHSNKYNFYCIECKKNICIDCKIEHRLHDKINLSKFNYSKESRNKLEEDIKNIENKINNLDIIKQNIITEIEKLKESSELEMKFIKILLYSYEYEEIQNNLNYYIIQNLNNFRKQFSSYKFEIYERLSNEGQKFISLLQNIKNIKPNCFNNNFKTITNHKYFVNHIDILNDGRLIASFSDKSLFIYNKDTYEIQLSIKEHSKQINSFTEINNKRIITCSDKTMKIIKLIGEDNYKIEQTLLGHTDFICRIIEIKENELISISYDKIMKIWKLNNENKFECITNIYFQNSKNNCDIFKLNENEFVTSSRGDKCIKFWNLNNYSYITTITNIQSIMRNRNMCLLENDLLCIGGDNSKGFYLIKISTHQLIKNITGPKLIYSISKCLDGLILCSMRDKKGNNNLVKYIYEEQNLKKIDEKIKVHNDYIISCIELKDGIIVSAGGDRLIKLWKE